jgi:hypothetical protein
MSMIGMIFDKQVAVERVIVPEMPDGMPFKVWKEMAARDIADYILKHNLMAHHSRYDIARRYTHEAFTCLIARPERKLP